MLPREGSLNAALVVSSRVEPSNAARRRQDCNGSLRCSRAEVKDELCGGEAAAAGSSDTGKKGQATGREIMRCQQRTELA